MNLSRSYISFRRQFLSATTIAAGIAGGVIGYAFGSSEAGGGDGLTFAFMLSSGFSVIGLGTGAIALQNIPDGQKVEGQEPK